MPRSSEVNSRRLGLDFAAGVSANNFAIGRTATEAAAADLRKSALVIDVRMSRYRWLPQRTPISIQTSPDSKLACMFAFFWPSCNGRLSAPRVGVNGGVGINLAISACI